MTILAKPFADKKAEKPILPIVGETAGISNQTEHLQDVESERGSTESVILVHRRYRAIPSSLTLFLFSTALLVLFIGIIGGVFVYRQYARAQMQRMRFHGFCRIPYDSSNVDNKAMIFMNNMNKWRSDDTLLYDKTVDILNDALNGKSQLNNYDYAQNSFKEELELDLSDEQSYSKISIPDFRDGRRGRFMHDFQYNQSCIIDQEHNRCFVMPLDRETVLPPRSLYDLVTKMYNGYYDIDTDIVRKHMNVVLPAVKDLSVISPRLVKECQSMYIYQLEKYVSGVYKRSIKPLTEDGKFAEFSGKNIVEFDLHNIADLEQYEKDQIGA